MNRHNHNKQNTINDLLNEYEAMSQQGTVGFFEEKVFADFAEHYEKESSYEKAIKAIEDGLDHHNTSSDLLVRKARILSEMQENNQALECLDEAFKISPSDISILLFKSEILSALGFHQEALDILDDIHQREEDTPNDFFWCKAIIQEQINQFEGMFNSLKQYLIINPRNVNALRKAWFCMHMYENYEESIAFHEALLETDPYSYLAWHNLGHAYLNVGKKKKAAWALEYSFITNPKFESGYKDYAEVCFILGLYNKALQAYEELLEHCNADASTLMNIGKCYEFKEDFGVAHAFYVKAEVMNPDDSEVHFRMGDCFAKRFKWECAIDSYKTAIAKDPRNSRYCAALAEAYFQIKEDDNANDLFQKAADIAPDDESYWIQYATFLMDIDKLYQAEEVLNEANMFIFDSAPLDYCLAACKFRLGKKKEAMDLLVNALNNGYDKHEIFFNLIPDIGNQKELINLIKFYSQN